MKRFLCMILTVAMLISGMPAVFAENDANSIGAVTEQKAISENQEEIIEEVTANAPLIVSEGTLVFNRDITLQNNKNYNSFYTYEGGGAILSTGTFMMNDGKICNNEVSGKSGYYPAMGGGVCAEGAATITGGEITNNTTEIENGEP